MLNVYAKIHANTAMSSVEIVLQGYEVLSNH